MTDPTFADTRADGQRWYVLPSGERFMSVTTVLGYISKFGLIDWSAGMTADAAVERAAWVAECAGVDPCHRSKSDDACGSCSGCTRQWLANRHIEYRDAAGDRGTKLHAATATFDLFGEGAEVDDDIAPMFANYRQWKDHYRFEVVATDMTVISHKWGYAGSLDKIGKFGDDSPLPKSWEHLRGLNLVLDEKTGKHVGISEGLQVTAYSRADSVLLPDGSEEPMPAIGGGLILHNRADKIQTREVYTTDANFGQFIHALRIAEGMGASLNSVLSRPINIPKGK